jgi:hypothetical protein
VGAYGGPGNCGWPPYAAQPPDLTGVLAGMTPEPILVGQPIALSGTVVNQVGQSRSIQCWVEFWAVDPASGWSDYLCDSILLGPLGPGETLDLSAIEPRVVYSQLPPGTYTIEMRIDATDVVAESDKTNNISRIGYVVIARPELTRAARWALYR